MNKKLIVALLLSLQIFCDSQEYTSGKSYANGAMDAVESRVSSLKLGKGSEQVIQTAVGSVIKGLGKSLKEGGEFDTVLKDTSNAAE